MVGFIRRIILIVDPGSSPGRHSGEMGRSKNEKGKSRDSMTSCEERAIDGINATPKVGIVLVNHEIDKIKGHFKVDKKKKK